MRIVMVSKLVMVEGQRSPVKRERCMARFHQWGVDYEEFDSGPGNYSTAIVEFDNGTVENVQVELVRFVSQRQGR